MEPNETEQVAVDEIPAWVKTWTGILAFVVVVSIVVGMLTVLFFLLVRVGLWLVGA